MKITININSCFECPNYVSNNFYSEYYCKASNKKFSVVDSPNIQAWDLGIPDFCPYKKYVGVGIIGKAHSGKTTLANFIRETQDFKPPVILKFADPLYFYLTTIKKSKNREFLIELADLTKKYFGENIFVDILKDKIEEKSKTHFIIVDDVRFKNEVTMLKKMNFFIIYLDIDDSIREERAKKAGLPFITDHQSEKVDELKPYADYIIKEVKPYTQEFFYEIFSGKYWESDY